MTTKKHAWDELTPTITTYLKAHEAKDAATAITAFTADAVVPGGAADLHFRFTMDGALVSRLVMEP